MRVFLIIGLCSVLSGCVKTFNVNLVDKTHEHVRELEMQNAALKAANAYLLGK